MRSRETGACRRSLGETSLLALAGEPSCPRLTYILQVIFNGLVCDRVCCGNGACA